MGSDPKAPNAFNQTMLALAAYRAGLPRLLNVVNKQLLPTELARINVAEQTVPRYANLLNDISNTSKINDAVLEQMLFDTVGRDKASTATAIDKAINPEFYTARADIGGKINANLDSLMSQLFEPNIEAERLINAENVRSGNSQAPANATNTVKNALQFSSEQLKRRDALDKALTTANQFLLNSRATFDPFGRSITSGGTTVNTGNQAGKFAEIGELGNFTDNLLSNIFGSFGTSAQINANRRDSLDRTNETLSSIPDY